MTTPTTESEPRPLEERRRLGPLGKGLIGFGFVLAMGLVLALVLALRAKKAEQRREETTRRILTEIASDVRSAEQSERFESRRSRGKVAFLGPPRADSDPPRAAQEKLGRYLLELTPVYGSVEPVPRRLLCRDEEDGHDLGPMLDAWSHPLLYRCPGPVHKHGWDLWSVGPNGMDEKGQGDDILVGEDVADVTSTR